MAGTAVTVTPEFSTSPESVVERLRASLNKIVDDVEVLRAGLNTLATNFNATLTKLDADAGVTDTNYNATQAVVRTTYDAAGDVVGFKVNHRS